MAAAAAVAGIMMLQSIQYIKQGKFISGSHQVIAHIEHMQCLSSFCLVQPFCRKNLGILPIKQSLLIPCLSLYINELAPNRITTKYIIFS